MKIGFFFGAGAEMGYGLPSGGKFAIDLFRLDPSEAKAQLRSELQNLNKRTAYATKWLPKEFWKKNIHAFGKAEFSSLIESSIENRKEDIIKRLGEFDRIAGERLRILGLTRERLANSYRERFGREIGAELYSQAIRLNDLLGDHGSLFSSEYYSAILDTIRKSSDASHLRRFAVAFLQLLVGSCGHDLISRLNQEIFTEAPDDLPIFDDIAGLFRVEMSRGGLDAIDLLISERTTFNVSDTARLEDLLCAVCQGTLEALFDGILDYQALIDSHFRYLFCPKTEWAKFTKMVIFMRQARSYIISQLPDEAVRPTQGYYHDLAQASDFGLEIGSVGTANYNNLLERIGRELRVTIPRICHLNGGVSDYYNPYTNTVAAYSTPEEVPVDQIHVPFILTQSGLKPLTSVDMSRRYVDLYDEFLKCDALVAVGFGFNQDDSHINGLFRKLIEEERKRLFWVRTATDSVATLESELLEKLRLPTDCRPRITPIIVSRDTRNSGDKLWLKRIADDLNVQTFSAPAAPQAVPLGRN